MGQNYNYNTINNNFQPTDRRISMYESITYSNKVLLIEDNQADARLVELLLQESDLLNCTITHKTTLSDAIKALEEGEDFAAILLDLSLPDSRGFETLDNLLARFPNNNVIVLTGYADKELGINAVKAGAQDFLVKGEFNSELLAKTLRFSIERNSVLNRLEETQRLAQIGNWNYYPDKGEFTASDEVYKMFGYLSRDIMFNIKDIENPEHVFHVFQQIHDETFKNPSNTFRKDIQIEKKSGEVRFFFVQCNVTKDANNHVMISGIIQDITERKLAEKAVLKSQLQYQNIFTKSKDAICICTSDGKFSDFNDATVNLTAYSVEQLNQMDVVDLFDETNFWYAFREKMRDGGSVQDLAVTVKTATDQIRNCELSASSLVSEGFEGYNLILRDVTEKEQAKKLREARDLAQKTDKLKEQFIASISHEMRTPMNAILGMSNLVLKTDLNKEQYNYISSVKQSSELLLGIVNDILEIATLQNGKIKFENQNFDLKALLDNMIKVMQYKVDEKNLKLELKMDEALPKVLMGDELRLSQILYNLVGNAIKFTDEGFVSIKVELLNESYGSAHIKFTVQDTGIGIPSDKIGAIFETFTRIRDKDRIFEGTGLGLSIAKNLVEYQGGKIWAESELGVGSTFYFDLILETGDEIGLENDKNKNNVLEIDPDMSFKLLLVEDHKMNQLVAKKTLEKQWANMELKIADNGKIATEILEKETFDVILMDVQMPIMDGYEATQHIRNKMRAEVAKLPILAMTAHANIARDDKFKEYGMDDFVLKPFKPEQLFQKITKYVNLNR